MRYRNFIGAEFQGGNNVVVVVHYRKFVLFNVFSFPNSYQASSWFIKAPAIFGPIYSGIRSLNVAGDISCHFGYFIWSATD